jgi:hypothetical protein
MLKRSEVSNRGFGAPAANDDEMRDQIDVCYSGRERAADKPYGENDAYANDMGKRSTVTLPNVQTTAEDVPVA